MIGSLSVCYEVLEAVSEMLYQDQHATKLRGYASTRIRIRQLAIAATTTHGPKANTRASGSHIVNAHKFPDAWKSIATTALPRACITTSVMTIDHVVSMDKERHKRCPVLRCPCNHEERQMPQCPGDGRG